MRQLHDFLIAERVQLFLLTRRVVNLLQKFSHLANILLGVEHFANLDSKTFCGPSEMGFENLSNVHARRHTKWIQDYIHRGSIGHKRHIFDWDNLGDNTFVTVTTGHLVTRLQAAFNRHVNLDHFLHTWRQLVTLC